MTYITLFHHQRGAPLGSRNAAKSVQKIPVGVRLMPDVVAKLKSLGSITKQIEIAVNEYLNK